MMSDLYEIDYEHWLSNQIAKLKSHQWEELDIDHLIEELEQLNKSNKRELESYLVVVLAHLLKWQFQPERRSGSWLGSIQNGRRRIYRLFKDQPSLRSYMQEIFYDTYLDAREWAKEETGLNLFPIECPYSVLQILDSEFLP